MHLLLLKKNDEKFGSVRIFYNLFHREIWKKSDITRSYCTRKNFFRTHLIKYSVAISSLLNFCILLSFHFFSYFYQSRFGRRVNQTKCGNHKVIEHERKSFFFLFFKQEKINIRKNFFHSCEHICENIYLSSAIV